MTFSSKLSSHKQKFALQNLNLKVGFYYQIYF